MTYFCIYIDEKGCVMRLEDSKDIRYFLSLMPCDLRLRIPELGHNILRPKWGSIRPNSFTALRYPTRELLLELVCEVVCDQLASWIAQWNLAKFNYAIQLSSSLAGRRPGFRLVTDRFELSQIARTWLQTRLRPARELDSAW